MSRSRAVVDGTWSGQKAWKAHPYNRGSRFRAMAYAAGSAVDAPSRRGGPWLKTNAFDEACGFPDLMRVFDGTRTG